MLETKVLETTVDLLEVDDIYTPNVPEMLKRKLTQRYENKCFSSILILRIVDILRYSDRRMVDNRLDGAAYIDVEFRVEGIMYSKGEVIHGCKAIKVSTSGVLVQSQYVAGMVIAGTDKKTAEILRLIRKDQIIPVVVDDVCYNIGKSQIAVRCLPYVPAPCKSVYYNITDVISPEDTDKLDSIIELLTTEQKLHAPLVKTKSYEFFKTLVYPYKTLQKIDMSPTGSKFALMPVELSKLLTIRDGMCISYLENTIIDSMYLQVSKVKINGAAEGSIVLESPYYPAIAEILHNRLRLLRTLRGFAEQYDTPEKNQEMMAYWRLCAAMKD
mgnify:CR=1 FL=1